MVKIDLTPYENGIYLILVQNKEGIIVGTKKLSVLK
jgi:hypothetical protein